MRCGARESFRAEKSLARFVLSGLLLCSTSVALATEIRIGGTGGALAAMELLGQQFAKSNPDVTVTVLSSLGSSGGIKALLKGAVEVAVSARALEDKERAQGAQEIEYAKTPFVFAVGSGTRATNVSTQELAEILSGKRDKWEDGTKIRLILRPKGDSDSELIGSISPAIREALTQAESKPGMLFAVTDQDSAENVEKVTGAFGSTTLGQIISEKRAIKALMLNGVEASPKSLRDGTYTLHKRLFMVLPANPAPAAQRFVAFVQSPKGQELLGHTGFLVQSAR
jgi:phosphate transport system substrate-binding protein